MKRVAALAAGLVALAAAGPASGVDPSLVGQWHLDEGSGSTVADSSGHGNNGTVFGGAQWVAGRFGAALRFDGATSRVQVLNSASLEPTSSVSISAWVKNQGSPGDYRYIVAEGATGCIAASYGLYTGHDGRLDFYVSKNRGTTYTRSSDPGPSVWDGNWHMVVGTFDGSAVRLFVDGSEVGSGTARTGPLEYLLPDSNDLFIGDYPGCRLDHLFVGTIDEVNVWSRALSSAEVQAAFAQAGQAPAGGGGQTTTSTSTSTSTSTGQGGSRPPGGQPVQGSGPPAVRGLTVSPSAFAVTARRHRATDKRTSGATVTYTDTQAALSSFSVLVRRAGTVVRGRCTTPPPRNSGKHPRRCFIYVLVGSFTHADRAGRSSFHFAGIRGRKLTPVTYRLDVTPSSHQRTGRTISAAFTIIS